MISSEPGSTGVEYEGERQLARKLHQGGSHRREATVTVTHNPVELGSDMVEGLPYDPVNPPADPPPGCADPLLWRVARALRDAHHPRPDGFCECKSFWPCAPARLADESLRLACERRVPRPRTIRTINIGRWRDRA